MGYCRFGLIGHPIAHSLSPALFKAGYDGKYPYELIQGDNFEESYTRFIEGYDGINVTAPFKELAYAKADIVSEDCRLIKATNLLVKTTEGVKAYNSDLLGVRMWLKEILNHPSVVRVPEKRTPPTSWAPPPAARGVARFSQADPVLMPFSSTLIWRASRTAYFVFPEAVGPRTHIRSISPERYLSRISLTLISSAGGSSAIGGMGINGFFAMSS